VGYTDKDHFIEFGKHSGMVNTKFKDGPVTTESFLRAEEKLRILSKAEDSATWVRQLLKKKKKARPLLLAATDNQSPPPNHRH
jgi:hypothetical protein